MQPSFWSLKRNQADGTGWYQSGHRIEYEISPYHEEINKMNPMKP